MRYYWCVYIYIYIFFNILICIWRFCLICKCCTYIELNRNRLNIDYIYTYIHIDRCHLDIHMGHGKPLNAKWPFGLAVSCEHVWRMPLGKIKQPAKETFILRIAGGWSSMLRPPSVCSSFGFVISTPFHGLLKFHPSKLQLKVSTVFRSTHVFPRSCSI